MKLFDASAIITLCIERKFDQLMEGWTIDLAKYEIGNAIWKKAFLTKDLKPEEGLRALEAILDLIGEMDIWEIKDKVNVLKIAINEGITYYDASYLVAAIEGGFTLITEDKELLRVTKRYTKAIMADEIPDEVSRQ